MLLNKKDINYYFGENIEVTYLDPIGEEYLVLKPKKKISLVDWVRDNQELLEQAITYKKGVLLRGFTISSISQFNKTVRIVSPSLLDYMYCSTPRTRLGGQIYTATEYPKNKTIPLHNENSYSLSWPNKIFFFSVITTSQGGETPIASSVNVYNKLDVNIKEKFDKLKVMYVRNYYPDIDLPWQEVFQTEDPKQVEEYCRKQHITCDWAKGTAVLKTKQVCQASVSHLRTGEKAWFNQAHLFHITALDIQTKGVMLDKFGVEGVPRNTFYGNGEEISFEVLEHIREVYNAAKITFSWQNGDVMMLDNVLTAHSRNPFQGQRKVVVAMS